MTKHLYREIEKAMGYRFKNRALLELALTHPSFRYENTETDDDNQRLEYLGDAVLSLISAEHLYKTSPEASEGEMSLLRSQLTADRTLAWIGEFIGIGHHIRLGRGEERSGGARRASNLADALEAIIGAAWIDGGARAVNRIFNQLFLPALQQMETRTPKGNPKGELQEYAQKNGMEIPVYETTEAEGPEHSPLFTIKVSVDGRSWTATAGSKREAERMAAYSALENLRQEEPI